MRYFDEPQEIRELEGKAKIKRSIGAIFAYRSSREAVSKKYLGAERASEEGPTRALAAECQAQGFFEMASVGPPRTDDAAPLLVPGPTAPSIAYPGLNAMQYTKSMIDQVFLIRKIVPAPARAHVKLKGNLPCFDCRIRARTRACQIDQPSTAGSSGGSL